MVQPAILIVEDSPSMGQLYQTFLAEEPWSVDIAETGAEALAKTGSNPPDAVLLDIRLPDMNGLEVLKNIAERGQSCAVIVMTAHGSVNTAVEAMRAGAFDFIIKPFTAERLLVTLKNALERRRLNRIVETFKDDLERRNFCRFIGGSLPMQAVYRIIDQAAKSRATVFITGESGTGKELCAEAVHARSPRVDGPFVALNCAAIPKDLMESQVFGHVKGSFTGAVSDYEGAASMANGGSLFLDEICEMDLGLQTKLLRFVQTGSFSPVGSGLVRQVDVRFICATNRDPAAEVAAGRFREDLFYRLHVIPIHLPPLRERDDDVIEIARHFLRTFATEEKKAFTRFSPDVEVIFRGYDWPGNVRQLANVVRNAVVLHDGAAVERFMLPPPLGKISPDAAKFHAIAAPSVTMIPSIRPLWQVEKQAIEDAIKLCDGNIPKAAAALGVSPSTLYRKKQFWEEQTAIV